jgi:hypothetical protein
VSHRRTRLVPSVVPSAVLALVLAPALAALAGCSDGDPDADPTSGPSAEPGASLGLTAPGSVLELGETARVPLPERTSADGEPNVVDLTLTSISEGDPSMLRTLPGTPWFARLTVTAVSGDAQRFFPADVIVARAGDTVLGSIAAPVSVGGCTRTGFTAPEPPLGSSIDTCVTFVVEPGGDPVDAVGYVDGEAYDAEDGTAVEWR